MERPFQSNERVVIANPSQEHKVLKGQKGLVVRVLIRDDYEAWILLDGKVDRSDWLLFDASEVEPETAPPITPRKTGPILTTGSRAQEKFDAANPEYVQICAKFDIPGYDHATTLLYLQTVEGNNGGQVPLSDEHMRSKRRTRNRFGEDQTWTGKYGSRYFDGTYEPAHDDFDCLNDLEQIGLLHNRGTGMNPVVALTDKGHVACGALIRHRAEQQRVEGAALVSKQG